MGQFRYDETPYDLCRRRISNGNRSAGKTAAVSGSTAGIGLAIAPGLAAAGALTIVNGRKQDWIERIAHEPRDS